jgi:peptidyl-prolyl cis-trans isomerase SurA
MNQGIWAQNDSIIDKIVAIVGEEVVLLSDIEKQYLELVNQNANTDIGIKCNIFNGILQQKLLLHKAIVDSVVISDDEVEAELERRFRHYIQMLGSRENFEKFYKKSIVELKDEFRIAIKEQLLSNKVRTNISQDINVSPSEVKAFFNAIPKDSIPFFNAQAQISQIVLYPKTSPVIEQYTLNKIKQLKERVINGESFETLAISYSEDPGSAMNGGILDFMHRNELVPEFAEAAFKLKKDSVSDIVKTSFGYHIIQGIERRGEKVKVRHILIRPQVSSMDERKAQLKLDSIRELILIDKLSFEDAVKRFSEDETSKSSAGVIYNNQTGNSMFDLDQISPELYFIIEKMSPGEVSRSTHFTDNQNKRAYRIVRLNKEVHAHKASLEEDYEKIKSTALLEKKEKHMNIWIQDKIKHTYISLDQQYISCKVLSTWYNNQKGTKAWHK